MPKFQKRLILGLLMALALALAIVFVVYQRLHGINQLKAMIHDIERAGETLEVARLLPPPIPDESNAVPALIMLTNRLEALGGLLRSAPPCFLRSEDGRLTNVFNVDAWAYVDRDPATFGGVDRTIDWGGFMADFALQTNLVETVLQALERPGFHTGHLPEHGFSELPFQFYGVYRNLEKLLTAGALYYLRLGQPREAHRCLIGLTRLIDGLENDRQIVGQLIRLAIVTRAVPLMWQALRVGGWRDEELAEWERYWAGWDFGQAMLRAEKVERAMTLDYFARLGGKSGTPAQRAEEWERAWDSMGLGIGIDRSKVNEYVFVPLWYYLWQEQDCCRSLRMWQRVIGLQREANRLGWNAAEDLFLGRNGQTMPRWARPVNEELNWFDQRRFLFSSSSLLTPEKLARRTVAVSALQRLTRAAIALRRFELRHGRAPERLDELTPDFLPAIPLDPMDLKPLRYRVEAGGWRLYSVGLNGQDDDGVYALPGSPGGKTLTDGLDIVWPAEAGK